MNRPKFILTSKTQWAAFLVMLIGLLQTATEFIPPEAAGIIIMIIGVIQAILRWLTDKPVTMKPK